MRLKLLSLLSTGLFTDTGAGSCASSGAGSGASGGAYVESWGACIGMNALVEVEEVFEGCIGRCAVVETEEEDEMAAAGPCNEEKEEA